MEEIMEIFILIIIIVCLFSIISTILTEEKIEDFNLEEAVLIDNFITYTRFGSPQYYLVYEFNEDKSIKEFSVSPEQYYIFVNSPISNKAN